MIANTLAGAITGVLVDAAKGLSAFITTLQNEKIPVALQTLEIDVNFTWSITDTASFSETAGISIWVFTMSETLSLSDTTKQTLTTKMKVVMVPKPPPPTTT